MAALRISSRANHALLRTAIPNIRHLAGGNVYEYKPGGPIWRDGPNDATPFPQPSKVEGSHHWSYERLLAAALIPLTGSAAVISGSAYPIIDGTLGVSLIIHSHIGLDACFTDYLHERKFPVIGMLSKWGLRAATAGALVGIYSFNTQDIGLTELVKRIWTGPVS